VEKEAGVKQFHFFLEGDVSLTGSRILHKSEDLIRNARFLLCGPDSCPLSGLPPHPVGFIGGTPRRPFLQPGFCKMPFGFASQRGLLSFSRSTQCKGRAFPPAVPYPCGDKKMGCLVNKSSLNFPACEPWAGPASPARSSPLASHFPGFSSAPVRQQRFARQRILSFRRFHAFSHRRSAANDSH